MRITKSWIRDHLRKQKIGSGIRITTSIDQQGNVVENIDGDWFLNHRNDVSPSWKSEDEIVDILYDRRKDINELAKKFNEQILNFEKMCL